MKNKEAIDAYKSRLKNEVDLSEKELLNELQRSGRNLEKLVGKMILGGITISGVYLMAQMVKSRRHSKKLSESKSKSHPIKEVVEKDDEPHKEKVGHGSSIKSAIRSAILKQASLVLLNTVRNQLDQYAHANKEKEQSGERS